MMSQKKHRMEYVFLIMALVGILGGFTSGLSGLGGGMIVIPLLVLFLQFDQHHAQGFTQLMMLPPIGILAVMNYYRKGHVTKQDIILALVMAAFFVVGSFFGSKLAVKIDAQTLKRIFGIIMLIGAAKLIFAR